MAGKIFNLQDNGQLVEMNQEGFITEDEFQSLLERYPDLLAGDQMRSDAPRRWLLVKREMGIADHEEGADRWSLDHLFIDQDGIPTLVEVKRAEDTRIRREVVGQILDYAANGVVYWPLEKLQAAYEQRCVGDGVDPDERLLEFLPEGGDSEQFWQNVKSNLQSGRVRMLIVADVIPKQLQRIIEFLNEQMDPGEILGVEIGHFVGQGLKTLVPRVIGQTAEAEARKQVSGTRKPPLTREQMQQVANDQGVGELYATLTSQLKPYFTQVTTSQTNIAFNGKISGAKSGGVVITFSPANSSVDKGLAFTIYIDRLAEYLTASKEGLVEAAPHCERIEKNTWAGDLHHGFIRTGSDFDQLIGFFKQKR